MKRYAMYCNVSIGDIFAQTVIWFVLAIITFGLASPFFMYYFVKLIIDSTEIEEFEG